MKITNLKKYTKEQMIKKLKKVILLNSDKNKRPIFIYKDSEIDLERVRIKDLFPLQLYELTPSAKLVGSLHENFSKKYKENILEMNGYFTYKSGDKRYALIPPIIEDVKGQKIIIDGLHRILLAKKLKKQIITVVLIKNIPEKLILPVGPNKWEELKVVKIAPDNKDKRKWLIPPEKGYLYYRNYQSVFQNVGKPRASSVDKKLQTV
ncbi:MAG: hypothetical protein Q7R51_03135 [bacterium]|nr:hypothetical protein [bacterium]